MAEPKKVKLSEDQQAEVALLAKRDSPQKVAKRWKISDDSLLRAMNGYPIQRGTLSLIERGLELEDGHGEGVAA